MNFKKVFWLPVIIACIVSACSNNAQKAIAKRTATPPIIDGQIDASWNNYSWLDVKNIRHSRVKQLTPDNLSGSFKVCWDTASCYFLFKITDNIKCWSNDTAGFPRIFDLRMRDYDGMEIYFDPANNRADTINIKSFNCKKFTYHSDSICSSASTPENSLLTGIQFAQSDWDKGYYFEIKLPWKNLNIQPANKLKMGFEVNVFDNDNETPSPDVLPKRASVLSWNDNTGENPMRRTDKYGYLILED